MNFDFLNLTLKMCDACRRVEAKDYWQVKSSGL